MGRLDFEMGPLRRGSKCCYAFPSSGESDARRKRQTYSSGQRYHQTLVGCALEISGDLSRLQNERVGPWPRRREYYSARCRCECARCVNISPYCGELQNLRSHDVFQCCFNWRFGRLVCVAAARSATGRVKCAWAWIAPKSFRSNSFECARRLLRDAATIEERQIGGPCRAAVQSLAMSPRALRCCLGTWGAS
jgi:hypothetical protein